MLDAADTPSRQPSSLADTMATLQEAAKSGTNLDTLVGRLVIEQGLATEIEVEQARAARSSEDTSLIEMLVNAHFVTHGQIARLKSQIEAERSGQKIPGYKLLGKLGAGAMATVFKAKQISLNRDVAIKVLPKKSTANPQFVDRFYAEGRAAAQLNHPNIVQAYDVARAGDYHYFVMEYVDGRTVYDDIAAHKRIPERDAIQIAVQVAEALEHAHSKGLIHRDVKPKNIMIASTGVVKLADLGLARAMSDSEMAEAEAGKAFGTPYYISPEQIRGEKTIGPQADIYSLGATLYHMVTGNVPFDGKNPSSVMHKHLKNELVPPDQVNPALGAGISQVIEMMMAKSRKARFQNCHDLLVDLRSIASGEAPVLAGREFREMDLVGLATAEATASVELQPDTSTGTNNNQSLVIAIVAVSVIAVISIIGNVIQLM